MWDRQMLELAQSFRVLRYDTRGHGLSDAPQGAYSLDRLGRDVVELLDGLRIGRAHFCGLSLGSFVGQWLGVHAPNRINRLTLSNTSPYLGPAPQWDELIRTVLSAKDMSAIGEMFMRNWFPRSMLQGSNEVVDEFRQMVLSTPPQGLAGCYAVIRDCDLRRTISLVTAPTLVIAGKYDTVTQASHSEAMAATIPGARLALLPGVHLLNVELPDEFMRTVICFLKEG
jgi:3-oxoadipate enol-lactonase